MKSNKLRIAKMATTSSLGQSRKQKAFLQGLRASVKERILFKVAMRKFGGSDGQD